MSAGKCIAIDAMGGEGGISVTLSASAQALQANTDLQIYLVGDEARISGFLPLFDHSSLQRLNIFHTPEIISDDDKPGNVLRTRKQSSMYKAVELVKNGTAQAMVSAGNTGALLMIGRHLLKTIAGIQKPALAATIPGASRQCYLLDVGANPDCDGRQLFEFAVMGSVLAELRSGQQPRVALLNIGSEHYKGTNEVQAAAVLLRSCSDINYAGFIEANALFEGFADVVVCDGFVGNVTIKCSAGVANVVNGMLTTQTGQNWWNQFKGIFTASLRARLSEQINPNRINGASLLGLQGSIIKSHGNASIEGFGHAIKQAIVEIENAAPQLIANKVAAIMATN